MKVYDLFPFFNELPLLELRLAELEPIVDRFWLCELPRTFTDIEKPLYASENAPLHDKLCIHTPISYPSGPHPTIDWYQRRCLGSLIKDADPDDVIMLSDVDEIPNRDAVKRYIDGGMETPITLRQKLYYHRIDLVDPGPWNGTVICRRKNLGDEPDMQELRDNRHYFPIILDGGWHFSWLGDGDAIAAKLEAVDIERESAIYGSGGIQEPPKDRAFLQSCYEQGADLFSRGRSKVRVPVIPGENQPHEIVRWLVKYPQYAGVDEVAY